MVRGGLQEEAIAFIRLRREEWRVSWRHPYLTRLTFTAGIGAFLVGYFTGVISITCIYDQNSFQFVLHENLVIMAIVGAMIGAAIGAWTSDVLGRKPSIMVADVLIFLNAFLLISRHSVVGTVGIGFGVGMASMISPIYIAEASPARVRGSLVSTYGFLIMLGQFWCYLINSSYTQGSRTTWHPMLERVWFPSVLQFLFLFSLPESPKMNYIKEVKKEVEGSSSIISEIRSAWGTSAVRRGLVFGVGLQVIHQLVGYNAIVYYTPNIRELARWKSTLWSRLGEASVDNLRFWISDCSIKRNGRRKQILYSMCGITVFFFEMAAMFAVSSFTSPMVSSFEVFKNTTCPIYTAAAPGAGAWTCMTCLQVSSGCGFCAIKGVKTGACLTANLSGELACLDEGGEWFTRACPIRGCGFLVTIILCYMHLHSEPFLGW
ncbi:hypothetical protein MKW98_010704 [Papaver atlanticum]|uniref:Major facilitator superfamily (MFS) profile domain-containing protein n=1 Tax=Papaver atlanticum TaxID=357466 RepID=A0AAD4SJK4_9MAGN|nr:hypothetical protein MKW98_010704 [Papaver atlanticum]